MTHSYKVGRVFQHLPNNQYYDAFISVKLINRLHLNKNQSKNRKMLESQSTVILPFLQSGYQYRSPKLSGDLSLSRNYGVWVYRYREVCDIPYIELQSKEELKFFVPAPSSFCKFFFGKPLFVISGCFLLHAST